MDIVGGALWEIELHHVQDIQVIQAPCREIGRHEHVRLAVTESLKIGRARVGGDGAVVVGGTIAVFDQRVVDRPRRLPREGWA